MKKIYFLSILSLMILMVISCSSINSKDNLSITMGETTVIPSITPKITSELHVSLYPEANTIVENVDAEDVNVFKDTFAENNLPSFNYGTFKERSAADTMDYFFYTDISEEEIVDYIEKIKKEGFNQLSYIDEYKSAGELTFTGENKDGLIVEIRLIQGEARVAIGFEDDSH